MRKLQENPSNFLSNFYLNIFKNKNIIILLTFSIIASCGMHMEKRRYTKGFYFSTNKSFKSEKANDIVSASVIKGVKKVKENITSEVQVPEMMNTQPTYLVEQEILTLSKNNTKQFEKGTKGSTVNEFQYKSENKSAHIEKQKSDHKSSNNGDLLALFLTSLLGVSSSLIVIKNRKSTLKYTRWANKNKLKSRSLLILSQLGLGYIGYSIGGTMKEMGFEISDVAGYIATGVTGAMFLRMHIKEKTQRNIFDLKGFFNQKIGHAVLCTGLLASSISIGNGNESTIFQQGTMGQFIEYTSSFDNKSSQSVDLKNKDVTYISNSEQQKDGSYIGILVFYIVFAIILTILAVIFSCLALCEYGTAGTLIVVGILFILALYNILMNIWLNSVKSDVSIE